MYKGSIRIVNRRWNSLVKPEPDEIVIDITRTSNSPLQNIHPMREHSMRERERVIELNMRDMNDDLARKGPMYVEMNRIAKLVASGKKVALQCYCAPSRCHGENYIPVIEVMAERIIQESEKKRRKFDSSVKVLIHYAFDSSFRKSFPSL